MTQPRTPFFKVFVAAHLLLALLMAAVVTRRWRLLGPPLLVLALVLQKPVPRPYPPPPLVLIGLRVPFTRTISYLTQFAGRRDIDHRRRTVQRFFETTDANEAQAIARGLGARYLCLVDSDAVRFPMAQTLELVSKGSRVRVYRILPGSPDP